MNLVVASLVGHIIRRWAVGCGNCANKVVTGVVGITKAALHIDRADESTIRYRRRKCKSCPHVSRNSDPKYTKTGGLTTMSQCAKCKCVIAAKNANYID